MLLLWLPALIGFVDRARRSIRTRGGATSGVRAVKQASRAGRGFSETTTCRFASNCKTRVVDSGDGKDQVDMYREWRLLGLRYLRLHPNCKPEPSPSRVSCNPRRVPQHPAVTPVHPPSTSNPETSSPPRPLNLFYPSRQAFRGGSSCVGRCGGLGRDAIRPHV